MSFAVHPHKRHHDHVSSYSYQSQAWGLVYFHTSFFHSISSFPASCFLCSVAQSCQTFSTPWTIDCQVPLSMGLFQQEYQSGLPFPTPCSTDGPPLNSIFNQAGWNSEAKPLLVGKIPYEERSSPSPPKPASGDLCE